MTAETVPIALAKRGDINWDMRSEECWLVPCHGITPAISSSASELALRR